MLQNQHDKMKAQTDVNVEIEILFDIDHSTVRKYSPARLRLNKDHFIK